MRQGIVAMPKLTNEQKALRELRIAIEKIALMDDHPPPPGNYDAIQITWHSVAKIARKAKIRADELLGPSDEH
jgi:hypothetical protein